MPNGDSRIDRIEENIEKLVDVVGGLAGIVKQLAEAQNRSEEKLQRIETAQLETTEKFGALVQIVDTWIRRPQPGV